MRSSLVTIDDRSGKERREKPGAWRPAPAALWCVNHKWRHLNEALLLDRYDLGGSIFLRLTKR